MINDKRYVENTALLIWFHRSLNQRLPTLLSLYYKFNVWVFFYYNIVPLYVKDTISKEKPWSIVKSLPLSFSLSQSLKMKESINIGWRNKNP